jgi:hypothetical protein
VYFKNIIIIVLIDGMYFEEDLFLNSFLSDE